LASYSEQRSDTKISLHGERGKYRNEGRGSKKKGVHRGEKHDLNHRMKGICGTWQINSGLKPCLSKRDGSGRRRKFRQRTSKKNFGKSNAVRGGIVTKGTSLLQRNLVILTGGGGGEDGWGGGIVRFLETLKRRSSLQIDDVMEEKPPQEEAQLLQ